MENLKELLEVLNHEHYDWFPRTPEELLKCRKNPESFDVLSRYFGLGLPVSPEDLKILGIPENLVLKKSPFAVSCNLLGHFVIHSHWPPPPDARADDYVHFGAESLKLMEFIKDHKEEILKTRVVADFGGASGPLGFFLSELLPWAEIYSLDIVEQALYWGRITAKAQNKKHVVFQNVNLMEEGSLQVLNLKEAPLDLVVFNPPMVVPDKDSDLPHRDGGELGIELPLGFLKRILEQKKRQKTDINIFCLITNPIISGRSVFFDKLKALPFKIRDKKLIDPYFNQAVAKDRGYDALGIERIELVALWLG